MSLKKTLILAIILLTALLYLFKIEMPAREELAKKDFIFRDIKSSEVESIEIKAKDPQIKLINLHYGKNAENSSEIKWGFSELKDATAEPTAISSLITALSELKLDNPLPEEDLDSDMSIYGLKDPEVKLKVKAHGSVRDINIGKLNQIIDKRYLNISDDKNVYLVSSSLYDAANKKTEELRDKTPLDFLDRDLDSIQLNNELAEVFLKQKDKKDWLMEKPVSANASREAVMELTRNLRNITAAAFIDDPSKITETGLDKPATTVKLSYSGNIVQELIFSKSGADKSKFYLQIKPQLTIFELTSDPFLFLSKQPDDFRQKEVFNFAADKVKTVEISRNQDASIKLLRDGQGWKINSKEGDKVFINQWLSDLSEIQAYSFPLSPTDPGFEKPQIKLTIESEGGQIRSLVVGKEFKDPKLKPESRLYFAAADDLSNPFTITEESYKKIAVKEEALLPQKSADPSPLVTAIATTAPVQ